MEKKKQVEEKVEKICSICNYKIVLDGSKIIKNEKISIICPICKTRHILKFN